MNRTIATTEDHIVKAHHIGNGTWTITADGKFIGHVSKRESLFHPRTVTWTIGATARYKTTMKAAAMAIYDKWVRG